MRGSGLVAELKGHSEAFSGTGAAPRPPAVIRTMAFSPLFLPVGQLVLMAEGCERAKRRRGRSHLPPEGLLRRGRVWAPLAEE